jgi:hypothetical protein
LNDHDINKFQMAIQLNADIPVMALPNTNPWMSFVPVGNKNILLINNILY